MTENASPQSALPPAPVRETGIAEAPPVQHDGPSFANQNEMPGQDPIAARAEPLTPTFETERCEFNAQQLAHLTMTEAERRKDLPEETGRRESFMVKRQKPQPVMRPSPELAMGSDRAAFNARWEEERRNAEPPSKAERKAAFVEMRRSQEAAHHALQHAQNFNRQSRR